MMCLQIGPPGSRHRCAAGAGIDDYRTNHGALIEIKLKASPRWQLFWCTQIALG